MTGHSGTGDSGAMERKLLSPCHLVTLSSEPCHPITLSCSEERTWPGWRSPGGGRTVRRRATGRGRRCADDGGEWGDHLGGQLLGGAEERLEVLDLLR